MNTEEIELTLLLEGIFQQYGYDFRGYSPASIKRRLSQARTQFGCATFSSLQDRILHSPAMLPKLLGFLTVQVTEMFRDPTYFAAIRERIVPHLKTYPSVKVWVPGCSTGEEVYSMAILFAEEGLLERTLFYGTDINQASLEQAQSGIVSAERIPHFTRNYQLARGRGSLSDYYTAAYNRAVLDKKLTARIVFSDHSLVSDHVFAEVHFVSCRNVLIYFERPLQDRAVGLFKDSLVRRGFLGLGSKESLRFSAHASAFEELSRAERLFQRKDERAAT